MSAVAGNQEVGGGCDGGGQHHHQGGYSHHHRHHGGGCGGHCDQHVHVLLLQFRKEASATTNIRSIGQTYGKLFFLFRTNK
ncbi:hypothetical protein P8452_44898 [Trifolium repens]|nr:hypothetical protein P8452_44898 [Trifolium repens]